MILAKREGNAFQTLKGHTYDALRIYKEYLERNFDVVDNFCNRWQIPTEKFIKNTFFTIYLHDIGKITEEFQNNIIKGKRSNKHPHPLYALPIIDSIEFDYLFDIPIEVFAILSHHTQLYNNLYADYQQYKKGTFLIEEIKEFIKNSKDAYESLGFSKFFEFEELKINEIPKDAKPLELHKLRRKYWIETNNYIKSLSFDEKIKLKSIFSFMFAILQLCDDFASLNFSEYAKDKEGTFEDVLENLEIYVPTLDIKNPISLILKGYEPYKFQKELYNSKNKFVILFAPCGRGKTEGALLWALNALKNFKRNKIILAMPTQVTSNAMYDRLIKIFGEENVGLFHGKSFIKLKDSKEIDDEEDLEEIRDENFKGNVFFKPITITTIDHVIYSFVHGFSQADFALGNIQNSVIIFDEVHYYEKYTLEHLLTLFDILKRMDIPHLLMSGTLPSFLMNKLEGYEIVVDEEGLNYKPFKLEYLENHLIWKENGEWKVDGYIINEIIENYKKGVSQAIILNTVERAKEFYKAIKDKVPAILYHSQFAYRDRVKKEDEIFTLEEMRKNQNKPYVIVATQVIEISLDMSVDVMYSELSPPDALGQRAGRLHRKGRNWKENGKEYKLKIFLPYKHLPYSKELVEKTINYIKFYEKPLNYRDIKDFVDNVYKDYNLSIPSDLKLFFDEAILFGRHWTDISTIDEEGRFFKVRDDKFMKIEVVPQVYFDELGEDSLKAEYMAKIPAYLILNEMKNEEGMIHFYPYEKRVGRRTRKYIICSFKYNYEIGFDYKEEEEFEDIL
ncbi:CRISPR-associated helicase/endonuclease Cas3 [Methanocaldococcus fervens]|uniref:CRISPR-associated helicase Cas3 n=1 Tax=Methanocaldococcus fervens (strain DSM 4213 / JCM 15782 / AG86) TaxID=573064 RepID=C7P9L2_METFA|nr:CRISPR-associated helicase/endonuclease Cas3 [Methanocaldococcus fervens]ACV25244.1 CRISPR-associated helicase Cas3 [Methanocaldococcus fervens AG86]